MFDLDDFAEAVSDYLADILVMSWEKAASRAAGLSLTEPPARRSEEATEQAAPPPADRFPVAGRFRISGASPDLVRDWVRRQPGFQSDSGDPATSYTVTADAGSELAQAITDADRRAALARRLGVHVTIVRVGDPASARQVDADQPGGNDVTARVRVTGADWQTVQDSVRYAAGLTTLVRLANHNDDDNTVEVRASSTSSLGRALSDQRALDEYVRAAAHGRQVSARLV